jgi:FHS family glucose/mannose:H+ symporter-like MFS transporter
MKTAAAPSDVARLHFAAFASIFCVGVWATSFGPALPFLADDMGMSLGAAGLLLTALFAGSITASGAIFFRLHHINNRELDAAGLAMAAGGLVLLGLAGHWSVGLVAAALLGAGDGLIVAAVHGIMATTSDDVPRAMNQLGLFFAVGAIAGPLWSGALLEATGETAWVYAGVGALAAAAAALTLSVPRPPSGKARAAGAAHRIIQTEMLLMALVLFLYVGAEIGLGSWVSSYAREAADAGIMAAALMTSGYWGALLLGRLVAGRLLADGHGAAAVLVIAIAGAGLASVVLAVFGGTLGIGVAAAFATGLFFGPIWPVAMGIGSRQSPGTAPAALVTIGNAGGLLFPWLQGVVLASAGPGEGIAVTGALCAAMLVLARFSAVRNRTYSG